MATIALTRPVAPHRSTSLASTITLDNHPSQCPSTVPNKHIPVCPPGPIPQEEPSTPPPSPNKDEDELRSLLYPPDKYPCVEAGRFSLYKIDADGVAAALDYIAQQPLPDSSQVFPWLHGLHPNNTIQQAFFMARKRSLRRTPPCLRGITVVKADQDLNLSRLKGAITADEFLQLGTVIPEFLDIDPPEGFSVRNFQIQAAKSAMTSDIIVYGDDDAAVRKLGWDIATAQQRWRDKHRTLRHSLPKYNTFICVSPFQEFEQKHPEIVSVNSAGLLTGNVLDFFHQERREMYDMSRASEIAHNVWLGPTPDSGSEEEQSYDILIECSDLGRLCHLTLEAISSGPDDETKQFHLDFPSSGSILAPTWSHTEADGILECCKWIFHLAHGTRPSSDSDGDHPMLAETPDGTILIHCGDGYTESTMLAVAYRAFATGAPVPQAWLELHTLQQRNCFAYPSDVALLTAIAPRLLEASPLHHSQQSLSELTEQLAQTEPRWFSGFDGSFPSRVLPYMYLGNLGHANNPDLLRAMGIGQILSVGEMAMWRDGEMEEWGEENICYRGRQNNTATLVHCRVGVSRSATICIAEVMRSMGMSFPRAYCFVRARRLNVIIQPHLRFVYELLKWEEEVQGQLKGGQGRRGTEEKTQVKAEAQGRGLFKRELEWAEIAREIALMNRPYAR
ncbi:tyrosine/serine/threonine protein phosphatase pps1 [Collariella sp. IMI 366227]|nr:tyrosine/serine/threonine protein phosphatase pps1 [Collariella sp. IMI 366227]